MDSIEPLALDRKLRAVARAWRAWRRRLELGEGLDDDPFAAGEDATRLVAFDAVRELPDDDPLRGPLLAWIHRLMEQRIDRAALCALTNARRLEHHVVDAPEHARVTLAETLRSALAEPRRRSAWLGSFVSAAPAHSATVALLWQRRREIAQRLGHDDFDALAPSTPRIVAAARDWLDRTEDCAGEWRSRELGAWLELALGTDAAHGWPAHLSLRTLVAFFRETRLFDDVRLDPGKLPRPVAASSFLRGLRRLGAALIDALAPPQQPFVIAHDPRGLARRTTGALLAGLPLSLPFAHRALGLGGGPARDQARALARVVLLDTRAQALRVLLREAALRGRAELESAFEEQVERTFGIAVPRTAAGSLWRLHVDDPERFAGSLLAAAEAARLLEAHDEDWYRNPRAAEELRARAALPPEREASEQALAAGARELERVLGAALR